MCLAEKKVHRNEWFWLIYLCTKVFNQQNFAKKFAKKHRIHTSREKKRKTEIIFKLKKITRNEYSVYFVRVFRWRNETNRSSLMCTYKKHQPTYYSFSLLIFCSHITCASFCYDHICLASIEMEIVAQNVKLLPSAFGKPSEKEKKTENKLLQ